MEIGRKISTDGLVFYVDGANSKSYPGSGTTWYDLSNSYDGTLNNGASISNGVAIFDGIDDYANIDPVVSPLLSTTQGTWMGWVKPTDATPTANNIILSFGDTNALKFIQLYIQNTSGRIILYSYQSSASDSIFWSNTSLLSDGVWAHLAAVVDGVGNPKLYLNGSEVTFSDQGDTSNATLWFSGISGLDNGRIGCNDINNVGNAQFFNGSIGNIKIYNTAFSAAQVLQNYNATKDRYL